ncbi:MarR family winged helix-turn-helix transcriptional regulator [Pannonibacter tanglangensis]|uniref:MarR family transcriptional regulator n=1 Tax=Pannonibacter tanglangensis TaxID=2750084 RepID=A0ABW9ZFN5_9HYPH|nr:MarR family winged helix-turn-helix transcriptional regulator [Pannonibacter sp. XCT-34]NBN63664.1 MarR family transcriptional regulator [Pannonibacter sp. XCT-34]
MSQPPDPASQRPADDAGTDLGISTGNDLAHPTPALPGPDSATTPDAETMARLCLGLAVRRTSNLVTRHYNAHLAETGLEVTQFSLLAGIASGKPASLGDLAGLLSIDRSTLTRNLRPLQAAGLIDLHAAQGRRQLPTLTEKGETVLRAASSAWLRAQTALVDTLGPEDTAAVRASLKRLRDAARRPGVP